MTDKRVFIEKCQLQSSVAFMKTAVMTITAPRQAVHGSHSHQVVATEEENDSAIIGKLVRSIWVVC
jgi:hypothetical protein